MSSERTVGGRFPVNSETLASFDLHAIEYGAAPMLADGCLLPFAEQIKILLEEEYPDDSRAVIAPLGGRGGIYGFRGHPIFIEKQVINSLLGFRSGHHSEHAPIGRPILDSLPKLLDKAPLVMDSLTRLDSRVITLDARDLDDNQVILSLRYDIRNRDFRIADITSVYGKTNYLGLIKRTLEAERHVFCNQHTDGWLEREGYGSTTIELLDEQLQLSEALHRDAVRVDYVHAIENGPGLVRGPIPHPVYPTLCQSNNTTNRAAEGKGDPETLNSILATAHQSALADRGAANEPAAEREGDAR